MRLILIRHARTDWSGNRYMGREDVPLSDTGRAQADALADTLATALVPVAAIWSSPLQRARDTAAPLARMTGRPVVVVDDLAEMDYGRFQGAVKTERRLHITRDHVRDPIPGGESLADVADRADRILTRLGRAAGPDDVVALVGHYRVNQFVLGALWGLTLDEIVAGERHRPPNASALAVDCGIAPDGRPRAETAGWLTPSG